jgi:hypothetical protein
MINEVSVEKLRRNCDPNFAQCKTTSELQPLQEIIGQERAVRALKFGLGIQDKGFNIYVSGYTGTGRTTAVKNFLEEIAKSKPTPSDWCYVNNFSNEYGPKAIKLPPGKGKVFQKDMKDFVESAKHSLRRAFESEDYALKRENTIKNVEAKRKQLIDQLNAEAQREGFLIQSTPIGLMLIPVIKGKPVAEEDILSLPPNVRDEIQEKKGKIEAQFRTAMETIYGPDRIAHEVIEKLTAMSLCTPSVNLVADLTERYAGSQTLLFT